MFIITIVIDRLFVSFVCLITNQKPGRSERFYFIFCLLPTDLNINAGKCNSVASLGRKGADRPGDTVQWVTPDLKLFFCG